MPFDPDTTDQIYTEIRNAIRSTISGLTNFTENSFNFVWTHDGFSAYLHEFHAAMVAVQLSGWVEFSGGPISEDDLEELGIDGVSAADIEEYISDEDLDRLAAINGISRDPGSKATGVVEFTLNTDGSTVSEGTEVTTEPDSEGTVKSYFTTEEVTDGGTNDPDGVTDGTVKADIEADEVGTEFNVGADTITRLPSPPSVVSSVTNPNPVGDDSETDTDGDPLVVGEDEEDNESLRDRVKTAVTQQSGGGTVAGIEGFIEDNVDGVTSASVDEKQTGDSEHGSHPHAHVIVEGGSDSDVNDAIADSHPSAVEHILVRPTSYTVDVTASVKGDSSAIDTGTVETQVDDYLVGRQIGDDVFRDKITQTILNADSDIDTIDSLTVTIIDEVHTFDSSSSNHPKYKLDKGDEMAPDSSARGDGIVEATGTLNGSDHTFTEDTDFDEATIDGDSDDAIDWGIGGDDPDEDTDFKVDYDIEDDITINDDEIANSGTITVSVV